MMIESYLLEQLVAVSECKTLSAAAQQLHITQPALSKSMQKLESILEVSLFDRTKNSITINETGLLAAQLSKQILNQQKEMIIQLQNFERTRHLISFGSCAPIPIADFEKLLVQQYPDITIESRLESEEEKLIKDLKLDLYQFVIISHPADDKELLEFQYHSEQLYLLVPKTHHLAKNESLTFSEIDGQNILLYSRIGSWNEVARKNLPNSNFMVMDSLEALSNVFTTGHFPAFTTDVILKSQPQLQEQYRAIPITDSTATKEYYFVCKKNLEDRFEKVINLLITKKR